MEDSTKTLARLLAVIFAGLFIGSLPFAFALYNVERSAFDAALYIQSFEDEGVYQRLPGIMAQALLSAAQDAEPDNPLKMLATLSQDEWSFFMGELFPPTELKILADSTVSAVMAYINGESDSAVLSLFGLKTHLGSPQGINALYGILKAQPDCTAEQLTAMAMGQQGVTMCNPPDTFLFIDLVPFIKAQIAGAVSVMPEQVTLIAPGGEQAQRVQDLEDLRLLMRLSPVLPTLFLLMVTILVVRSLNDWLNWWGYPLLMGGLLSMLVTFLSKPLAAFSVQAFVIPLLPDILPADAIDLFRGVAATIVSNAIKPTVVMAGFLALVGLGMVSVVIIKRVFERRSLAP